MKITPIDINHKSFNKKMFGIDEIEVQTYLEQVASQMEELIHERNALKEALREKELQMNDLRQRDQVLQGTITTASQMADKFRQDSEREGKLIIADAQQKAEIILRDSRDSLKKMYQEIADLKRVRMQFEANLKALAQAHLTLLEQGEKYMPSIGLPNVTMETETAMTAPKAATATQSIPTTRPAPRSPQISPLSVG
ncbi:MAG: hypothetical protein BroJett040_04000 [Oligoflexia bacterium]|nr:MAG: hypothetical protein BroJett040_04000 [Oligoflexia bacterium]